jgi:hypothetical protein
MIPAQGFEVEIAGTKTNFVRPEAIALMRELDEVNTE